MSGTNKVLEVNFHFIIKYAKFSLRIFICICKENFESIVFIVCVVTFALFKCSVHAFNSYHYDWQDERTVHAMLLCADTEGQRPVSQSTPGTMLILT